VKDEMEDGARFRMLFREEHAQFLELTKHFFHQFFENDLVSRGSEARLTVIHILALLAVPPIFYTIYLIPVYDNIFWNFPWQYPAVSLLDHSRYVMLSMIVIGLVAILEWDALFLDRRDFAILTPLPVPAATIFKAKITALLLLLGLFTVDVAGVPTVLYPLVETMAIGGSHVSLLRLGNMVAAHGVAVFSGSAFMFLFFVAVQGLLVNLLGPRAFRAASRCFQLSAIVVLLLALFLLLPITSTLVTGWDAGHGAGGPFWFPPLWFAGVYQTLLGSSGPGFHALAWTAVVALGLVALAGAAGYIVNYHRHTQQALEVVEPPAPRRFGVAGATRWVLMRFVLRQPLERATYFFVMNTFVRSTKHRLYLAAYVGVGFALAAFGIFQLLVYTENLSVRAILFQPNEALLSIPLILSFFLLSGMRVVFTIPAELPANWIFQIAEDEQRLDCCAGVRKVMTVRAVLLPATLFPIYAVLWGWPPALEQLIFNLVLSLILIELLLINFRKIPFTCSYQPGKANITVLGLVYWLAFATYAYTMAALERRLLYDEVGWLAFVVIALVVLAGLRWWRKATFVRGQGLIFEDAPAPEVQTLGLLS
jgi:hypothetical protein